MADDDEVTPAGWYRQADDPQLLRWWDGEDWTDDTMLVPETARRATGSGDASPNPRATARPTATPRKRGATPTAEAAPTPRRTRRDAMAEAEAAEVAGAAGGTDTDGDAAVALDRSQGRKALQAPDVATAPVVPPSTPKLGPGSPPPAGGARSTAAAKAPAGKGPATKKAPTRGSTAKAGASTASASTSADPTPVRRRRTPDADGGTGYRRPPEETGASLAPDDDWLEGLPLVETPRTQTPRAQTPRAQTPRAETGGAQTIRTGPRRRPEPEPAASASRHRMAPTPEPEAAAHLLRVIVRAGVIAVVIALAAVVVVKLRDASPGGAPTLAADPTPVTVDSDAPRLDQIVLQLKDLPRGWESQTTDPSSDDICDGRIPRSVIAPTGIESAAFTKGDSGSLIGNVVQEFPDVDTAKAFMDLTARVIDSCRAYSADNATVHLSPLRFPRFDDQTFVAAADGDSPGGKIHGAIVYVRYRTRVASVIDITFGDGAVNEQLIQDLVRTVADRMTSKPAISQNVTTTAGDSGSGPTLPGGGG